MSNSEIKQMFFSQNQNVAFLGLGTMGIPMAINLVKNGFAVKAWNRTTNKPSLEIAKNANVIIVNSLQEAVNDADIICICVSDVADVKSVIFKENGVINYAKKNALIIDFSTIGAKNAQEIAQVLHQDNLRFLDAPISGGDIGAKNGTLTIMVGGDEKDFDQAKPLFEAMGKNIYLCGGVGSGQAVKMCNQVLCSLNMIGLCEAIAIAEKQGINPSLMIEVCQTGAASSWALSNLALKAAMGDYQPGFMVKHILKDLRLVQESTVESLPGITLAENLFKQLLTLDLSEKGTQAMMEVYRNKVE